MLSLTSEYALRAMTHLAKHQPDWPIPGKQIAEEAGIPPKYLSKVLGDLVRAGLLEATRGRSGGFRMARPAREISLLEVLVPFERIERRLCPFGNDRCGDEDPCLAQEKWKQVLDAYQKFLERTSIHDVSIEKRHGQPRTSKRMRPCTPPEPG